ncbi:MAG: hypothetical protein ACRDZO_23170 [Egibacteraceae bacterium]
MKTKSFRRSPAIAGLIAAALGLVVVTAALAHSIAVTGVALTADGWRLHRSAPGAGSHVIGPRPAMVLICLILAPINHGFRLGVAITATALHHGTGITRMAANIRHDRLSGRSTSSGYIPVTPRRLTAVHLLGFDGAVRRPAG